MRAACFASRMHHIYNTLEIGMRPVYPTARYHIILTRTAWPFTFTRVVWHNINSFALLHFETRVRSETDSRPRLLPR